MAPPLQRNDPVETELDRYNERIRSRPSPMARPLQRKGPVETELDRYAERIRSSRGSVGFASANLRPSRIFAPAWVFVAVDLRVDRTFPEFALPRSE